MVLLTISIYMVSIVATAIIGGGGSAEDGSEKLELFEVQRRSLFGTVSKSMLTVFRCYMNDCISAEGRPLITMLVQAYGVPFVFAYIFTFLIITFGLFNLITAIYIEQTLSAAKSDHERLKTRRVMESVRIAKATKRLLMKFCVAQQAWVELKPTEQHRSLRCDHISFIQDMKNRSDFADSQVNITKEVFHIVLLDQEVQSLMDDLDIPPDRAHLFDIFDADRSGDLRVTELVEGLLKVRGEPRKSDVVAALLAVRSIQGQFGEIVGVIGHNSELLKGLSSMVTRPSFVDNFRQPPPNARLRQARNSFSSNVSRSSVRGPHGHN